MALCFVNTVPFLPLSQLVASDGVQESTAVTVAITVLDANDNTPIFPNVSYNVNLFIDMMPGEAVLQVHTLEHTCLVCGSFSSMIR